MAKYEKSKGSGRGRLKPASEGKSWQPSSTPVWRKKVQNAEHTNGAVKGRFSQEGSLDTNILRGKLIQILGIGYRIMIKELGPAIQVLRNGPTTTDPPYMEAMGSNDGVVRFEDLEDVLASENDVAHGDLRRNSISHMELEGEVAKETFAIQTTSFKVQDIERACNNLGDSIHSLSRTKTAYFSQYGFSEEVVKLSHHLLPLGDETAHKHSENEYMQPPSLEKSAYAETNNFVASPQILETDVESLGEIAQPLVFETPIALNHKGKEKKKATNRKVQNSANTSESMTELAKASLEVGDLLGLSVRPDALDVRASRVKRWISQMIRNVTVIRVSM
ncbi:hypothetical protein Cgig2_010300 [Carnegiea gigantea]|uniref:Uncharacterized protein n=1 Tax=Carnegiea gigantea TaxID=171969 RepID=A0A9Q1QJI6_9CARY|nr:hypothetical protein Cgig2_010300 [Carnegiea gigantea]